MIDEDELDRLNESVDPPMRLEIQRAIGRLPTEIALFAIDQCHFTAVGNGVHGLTLPGSIAITYNDKDWTKRFVIVLLDDPKLYGEEIQSTVAHEIAHAWRGEHGVGGGHPLDAEVKASALARSWGFTGHAATPEHFELPPLQ